MRRRAAVVLLAVCATAAQAHQLAPARRHLPRAAAVRPDPGRVLETPLARRQPARGRAGRGPGSEARRLVARAAPADVPGALERCATPDRAAALHALADAGVTVSGPLPDDDVCALAAGLLALPPAWRRAPAGAGVHVHLDDGAPPSPSGMAEPEWRDGRFTLTPQAGHATFRDEALEPSARRRLWRARATVHALLSRWDDERRWSQAPSWRRANGWVLPLERPLSLAEHSLNQARTAWARPRGATSARLDFLTFAEAALAPVTALPTDDLLRCQDFTRHRALHGLLGGEWSPGACPAFDAWAREGQLDSIEVLLVQASGRSPESLFGHLLVRPVWTSSVGPSFDTAVQFAALTLPRAGPVHLARGLFGGYSLGVFTVSMAEVLREKLSGEQRSMTRWKLALSRGERRRFLERTWEFERRGRFAYAFFSDNCASVLVWMLESSLDEPALAKWPAFVTSPAAVLDDLFRARRRDGTRLLSRVTPAFEATSVVARRDEAQRLELERTALARLGVHFGPAHDASVAARRAAYPGLAEASRRAPAALHPQLFTWWALSARIERAVADEALHARREDEEARLAGEGVDLEEVWSERLGQLERESTLQQQLMLLDRESFSDALRRRAKARALTPAEEEEEVERAAALALFDEVTTLQGELVADVFDGAQPQAFLDAEHEAARALAERHAAHALPVSGHWRASVGAGVWRGPGLEAVPVLRLDEAGLLELLGEQRVRGLGAPVGVRLLEASLTLSPVLPSPVVESHFTLVAFDSLAPPAPPAPWWKRHLGFGFEVATDYRAWRSVPSLSGGAGWVLAGVTSADARSLFTVGLGPAGQVGADAAGRLVPLGGFSTRALGRLALPGRWPSALRVEARHSSLWGPARVVHELRGDAALEWVVSWSGRPRLLIRPTASLHVEPQLGRLSLQGLVLLEPAEGLGDLAGRH